MKRSWKIGLFFSVVLCLLFAVTAGASGITPMVNRAESQFVKGNTLGAATSLRQAMMVLYNKSKLQIERAVLVTQRPAAMGHYQARKNNKYKAKETIIIYVEPVGYHFAKRGGSYSFGIVADFAVTDTKGNILGGKKGFGSWKLSSLNRPLFDFYMTLTYHFTGIKPGKYVVITTLTGKNGAGSTTIRTPIEIIP